MDQSDAVYADPAYQRLRRALSHSARHDFYLLETSPPAAARAAIETLRDDLTLLRGKPVSLDRVEWPPRDGTSAEEAVERLMRKRAADEGTELLVLDTSQARADDNEALAALFSRLETVHDELLRDVRGDLVLLAAAGTDRLFAQSASELWSICRGAFAITLETPIEGNDDAAIEAYGTLLPEEQRVVDEALEATRVLARDPRHGSQWQLVELRRRALGDVLRAVQERDGPEAGAAVCVAALEAVELMVAIEPRLCQGMGICAAWRLMLGQIALAQGHRRGAESQVVKAVRELRADAIAKPADWQTSVELSRALVAFGDCYVLRGDFDEALALHEEALALCRVGVREDDSSRREWRRDLAATIDRVGDLRRKCDDLEGARAAYEEALALYRTLYTTDPIGWSGDVAISLNKLGALQFERDDLDGAGTLYEESVALRRALLAHDPSRVASLRGLALSLENLGDVRREQDDGEGSLALYEEALGLREMVLASDPTRVAWWRSLVVVLECVGDVRFERGDLEGALSALEEALAARRVVLARDPADYMWRHTLALALNRTAEVQFERGEIETARSLYEESRSILDELVRSFPQKLRAHENLAVTLTEIARLHWAQGDRTLALDAANRARSILGALLASTGSPLPEWEDCARQVNALITDLTG